MDNGILLNKNHKTYIPNERKTEFVREMNKEMCHAGINKCYNYC